MQLITQGPAISGRQFSQGNVFLKRYIGVDADDVQYVYIPCGAETIPSVSLNEVLPNEKVTYF
ncbi:hypothetical protein [Pelagibaculum spongiae]|uniref:Uncharacterized protein n=1 Tax=Pelagibaculum spongiae TaxID=2080658 RepID=A0A2V1GWS3_9GAMM|nr:hypothetical protein [Pelagibaculum spongiae]PVZ69774.1 hypothetical protein DC094_10785 [Pelagibaculum spongiae]